MLSPNLVCYKGPTKQEGAIFTSRGRYVNLAYIYNNVWNKSDGKLPRIALRGIEHSGLQVIYNLAYYILANEARSSKWADAINTVLLLINYCICQMLFCPLRKSKF